MSEPVAWQYSYELWGGGWSSWSAPLLEKPVNPDWRIRPLFGPETAEKLGIAHTALKSILEIPEADCERYVKLADDIALKAVAELES